MPVVTVAPNDALLEKLKSNLHGGAARGGELFVFADRRHRASSRREGVHVIRLPEHCGDLSPILHVVPLQLLRLPHRLRARRPTSTSLRAT
jgi:glucosamine--fructose-6-phosphate aminotransferase (isomerizing)